MAPEHPDDITSLLRAWRQGEERALGQLVPMIDKELRAIARRHLGSVRKDASLTTTALFALCARIMRGILVDHARARRSAKRGGGAPHLPLDDALQAGASRRKDLVAIDDALTALAEMDPRKGRVVELRFFGGMTVKETAEVLSVSPETVARDWRLAKLWLLRELSGPSETRGSGAPR